jgi:hypothetical protein
MPLKYICGPKKTKKTKQTLLLSAYPPINNVIPVIPMHLNLMLRRIALKPLKPIELKRYT